MPSLWDFDEVERDDADRATQLRRSPRWPELIRLVCDALRTALRAGNARFGFDESSSDSRDLRANIQFPIGRQLFDWLFNGRTGYRAQFRIGCENGHVENARLVSELRAELSLSVSRQITARRLSYDFKDKEADGIHNR